MRLLRADVLLYFTVFTGQVTKSLIFHPVDFGEPFRRPTQKNHSQAQTWGVQNQLGASKNAVKQNKNTPLSLWGSTAPGCPGAPAASPAWVNMSTGSAMGLGGGPTPIYIWGTCWDRFGIVLGFLGSFWDLEKPPRGLEMLQNTAK